MPPTVYQRNLNMSKNKKEENQKNPEVGGNGKEQF